MPPRGFDYGAALIALLSLVLVALGVIAWHQSYGLSLFIIGCAALCLAGLGRLCRGQSRLDKLEAEMLASSHMALYRSAFRSRSGR